VLNFTGAITMSAWIKPTSSSGERDILPHGGTANPDAEVFLRLGSGTYACGRWAAQATPSSPARWELTTSTTGYTSRACTTAAAGACTAMAPKSARTGRHYGAVLVGLQWAIGSAGWNGRYFQGWIDECASTTRVECDQVAALAAGRYPTHSSASVSLAANTSVAGSVIWIAAAFRRARAP
jgi:hypothetical protein